MVLSLSGLLVAFPVARDFRVFCERACEYRQVALSLRCPFGLISSRLGRFELRDFNLYLFLVGHPQFSRMTAHPSRDAAVGATIRTTCAVRCKVVNKTVCTFSGFGSRIPERVCLFF